MTEKLLLVVPTERNRGLGGVVSDVFAKATTFTFIEVVDGEVSGEKVEENVAADLPQGSGPIVMKTLKDKGVDYIIAGEMGSGAKTLMELIGIKLLLVEPGIKVSEAVREALAMLTVEAVS